MRLRLPLHILISFMGAHLVALAVIARCAMANHGDPLSLLCAMTLAFGATAALFERTWGVGLMLASATAFFANMVTSGVVDGYPSTAATICLVGAVVGTIPFVFTMRYMARFHFGATILFMLIAGALGTGTALLVRVVEVAVYSGC
jgi:hypothetical protein